MGTGPAGRNVGGRRDLFGASNPARVVSDSPRETEKALCARNIRIDRSGALDLEEILSHLMRRGKERRIKSLRTGE